jgi:hypothetical protein
MRTLTHSKKVSGHMCSPGFDCRVQCLGKNLDWLTQEVSTFLDIEISKGFHLADFW